MFSLPKVIGILDSKYVSFSTFLMTLKLCTIGKLEVRWLLMPNYHQRLSIVDTSIVILIPKVITNYY